MQKLDDWADDLKQGLEQDIKETDREIKEVRAHRRHQRRELFDKQDEIEEQRNRLIEELEEQLKQKVEEDELFFIEWEMV